MKTKKRLVAIFTAIMLLLQVFYVNTPIGIAKASSEQSVTTEENLTTEGGQDNKEEGKTEGTETGEGKTEETETGEGKTEGTEAGEGKTEEGKTEETESEEPKSGEDKIEVVKTEEDKGIENKNLDLLNAIPKDITNDYKFITDVKITDSKGGELGNKVGRNSEIRVEYTWSVPDNHSIKAGDYYSMNLPKEIQMISDIDQPLISDGEKIADLHISKAGVVKITFTSFVENNSGVNGGFHAQCDFNEKEIPEGNPVPIKFFLQGEKEPKVINVSFEQPVYGEVSISKSGKYDASTNEITWTILVNNDKKSRVNKGAIITDDILKGQEYVDGSAYINGSDQGFDYSLLGGDVEGTLSYEFSEASNDAYTITYKTKPDLSGKKHGEKYIAENTVILNNNDGEPVNADATVTIPVNYIKKEGSYNNSTKKIDWSITVNSSLQQINNAIILDTIPEGLEIERESIKIDGDPVDDIDIDITEGVLKYTLGSIGGEHVITFSTKVVDTKASDSNTEETYVNTATLKDKDVEIGTAKSEGVGVPTSVIEKIGAGYNAATHEITWKVIVNGNGIKINNAVVVDTIPAGQEYVKDSFLIDNARPESNFNYDDATRSLKYEFPGEITKAHTITFKTKVLDKKIYGNNGTSNIKNTATLTGEGVRESSSTATQKVTSNVITKTGTGYDYINRIVSWKVVINSNKMPINNAIFKDNIPKGHKYVEGSFVIDGGLDSKKAQYIGDEDDVKSGTLTYEFPGKIDSTYTITFKTEVVDLTIFNANSNINVKNTGDLTGDEVYQVVKSEGTQVIKNQVISKTSDYKTGNDYIDWKIKTTSNFNIPLKDSVIEDTLQQGLELQTDTIKLKKLKVDANGNLTAGEDVTVTKDNIKYDIATGKFEFKFTEEINGAFELSFTTAVTKPGTYSNTATFKGSGGDQSSSVKNLSVRYSDGGGWAEGKTGSIKVIKVDEKDEKQTLQGAVFHLLDDLGNVIKISSPTGNDGTVVFDKVKFNLPYFIKEVTPPNGYELSKEVYKFTLKNEEDKKNIQYNFKNSKVKGTIEFTKVDEDSKGIKGAEFALYDENDAEYKNPLTTSVSDDNGIVKFEKIDHGQYIIKETKAPTGYNTTDKILTATIPVAGGVVNPNEKEILNTKIKGDIEFVKKDEGGNPLKGAEFKIYKKSDASYTNPLFVSTSNESGIVEFKNIEYGEYNIRETKSPTGYYVSGKIITATIENHQEKVILKDFINNKFKADIVINKVDERNRPLKDAEFTLYSNGQKVKSLTSDQNGVLVFESLEYGDYIIKETKAPSGYRINTDEIKVSVKNGETQRFTVKNIYIAGGSGGSSGGEDKPSGGNGEQKPGEEKPEEQKPGSEEQKPGSEEQKPGGEEQKPDGEEQKPNDEEQKPSGSGAEEITDSNADGTSGDQDESTTEESINGKSNLELEENTSTNKLNIIPKTGGGLDSILLSILGLVPTAIGTLMFIKIRKRENS